MMGTEGQGLDGLQVLLTGARTPGAVQRDARLSLGGYGSSTRAEGLRAYFPFPHPSVRIVFVGGVAEPGMGELRLLDASGEASWQAPGEVEHGPVVTIPDGERRVLVAESGESFVVVERTNPLWAAATLTVQILRVIDGGLGLGIWAEGDTEGRQPRHRCVRLKNATASEITAVTVWNVTAETRVALDAISDGRSARLGSATELPNLTWVDGTSEGAGLVIGSMAAGAEVPLWLEVRPEEDAAASPAWSYGVQVSWDDGSARAIRLDGMSRLARADAAGLAVWVNPAVVPGPNDAPDEVLPSEGGDMTDPVGPGEYSIWVARRDRFGLTSAPILRRVIVDAEGDSSFLPPGSPESVTAGASAAGRLHMQGVYNASLDRANGATIATEWRVWVGVDENPDTSGPPALTFPMPWSLPAGFESSNGLGAGMESVGWIDTDTPQYPEGAPMHVSVAVAAEDGTIGPVVTLAPVTARWALPDTVVGAGSLGGQVAVGERFPAWYEVDGDAGARVIRRRGRTEWFVGARLVLRAWSDGSVDSGMDWTANAAAAWLGGVEESAPEGGGDPVEVAAGGIAYIVVDGLRVLQVHAGTGTVTAALITDEGGAFGADSRAARGWVGRWEDARVQVWDPEEARHRSVLSVDGDGEVIVAGALREHAEYRVDYIDEAADARFDVQLGATELWVGEVCVWRLVWDSDGAMHLETNFAWTPGIVTDAEGESDGVHYAAGRVWFVLDERCFLDIDIEARTIKSAGTVPLAFEAEAGVGVNAMAFGATAAGFQVFDADDAEITVVGEYDAVAEALTVACSILSRGEPVEGW